MPLLDPSWQRVEVLEAVFDQISDAVFLYDRELRIKGLNQAAQRLFGMTDEEMLGKHCAQVFGCEHCDSNCGIAQGISHSCIPTGTVALKLPNGLERLVVIRTTQLLDADGAVEGVVATVKDVSREAAPFQREIVAHSHSMRQLLTFVKRVATSEASSILVEGENGTGKDLIAATLHYQSLRRSEPFLAINCAAIPETLLESELFGYEKGAFTDARAQKRGLLELADKGTLFLDEVGEIPLSLQVKLLRVLEDQTFRRLGGVRDLTVDLRVVAATNKNLREAVKEGAFRQDLYYRLNVIQILVPPLRERSEDVLPLAKFFIEHYNRKFKRQMEGMTIEAEQLLLKHDWPGNVRELRNAVERAMIVEDTAWITAASLPIAVRSPDGEETLEFPETPDALADPMSLVEQERRLVVHALEKSGGNQTHAARLLRVTRDTLRYKMKKFNLR